MARLIKANDSLFREIAFGGPSERMLDFIDRQTERSFSNLNEMGRQWLDRSKQRWEEVKHSNAFRITKALARKVLHGGGADVICELTDIGMLQHARSVNARYIMANPKLRMERNKGRINGYDGVYVDAEPDSIGESHRDYRRVMNGIVRWEAVPESEWETSEAAFEYDAYFEPESEMGIEEPELDIDEQVDILFNWSFAESLLETTDEDFSNEWNGTIKQV